MNFLITGFPHSGTTIIREIMKKTKDTDGPDFETRKFQNYNSKNQVIKWPFMEEQFVKNLYYENVNKVFLIRNPKFCFSSIKRRKKFNVGKHRFNFWKYTAQKFIDLKNTHTWHCYRYEDIVSNNESIFNFLDSLGLEYDENILLQKTNDTHRPAETDHVNFRNWQVGQKIENKNFAHKLTISKKEEYYLENLEEYKALYGDEK